MQYFQIFEEAQGVYKILVMAVHRARARARGQRADRGRRRGSC